MTTTGNPVASPRLRYWVRKCRDMRITGSGAPAASNSKAAITTFLALGGAIAQTPAQPSHGLTSAEQTEILLAVPA